GQFAKMSLGTGPGRWFGLGLGARIEGATENPQAHRVDMSRVDVLEAPPGEDAHRLWHLEDLEGITKIGRSVDDGKLDVESREIRRGCVVHHDAENVHVRRPALVRPVPLGNHSVTDVATRHK